MTYYGKRVDATSAPENREPGLLAGLVVGFCLGVLAGFLLTSYIAGWL